ncbi:MAG: SDR family oxidoreductase [Marinifilaceae bacterium]
MKRILLTGATGYIGKRLLPALLEAGYTVICTVRDKVRFHYPDMTNIELVEVDFLKKETLVNIPVNIDYAFYLMHSMDSVGNFQTLEESVAHNFTEAMSKTTVEQVIYLSGMINEKNLSPHLKSRKEVEHILSGGTYHLTTLRAGIIIGSGGASFEIIRDLVEKLPFMVAPKWLKTKCQPIAIRDLIKILTLVIADKYSFDKNFDIGGPDILTYREMLLQYAEVRHLKRYILTVPVMSPRLSSYWLFIITSVPYPLAKNLVDSMKIDFIARDNLLINHLNITPIHYKDAVKLAFDKIEQNDVVSSWRDSIVEGRIDPRLENYMEVPENGCFKDIKQIAIGSREDVINRIWAIGGNTGWYYANSLWKFRGIIDRVVGGVGLRRSRTNITSINSGDVVDFWRVIIANKDQGHLLLYAEMKLPGEAWLEFKITDNLLIQTATFRPHGLSGRLYWYAMLPFHAFLFRGMIKRIGK